MTLDIKLQITGVKDIQRSMASITNFITDLKPLYNIIKDWWYGHQKKIFDSEGSHLNNKAWQELSDKYNIWKKKNYPGQPILVMTGKLRGAMTGESNFAVKHISSDSLRIGISGIPYWAVHNFGYGPQGIPQRKYVGANKKMMVDLDKRFQAYLDKLKKKAFGGLR